MKIIRKYMLSIICNLNIVHLIENHHISITGPKGMSDFHQIHHQQIYVKDYFWFLYWQLSRCDWRNHLCSLCKIDFNFWNGRVFWSWKYQFAESWWSYKKSQNFVKIQRGRFDLGGACKSLIIRKKNENRYINGHIDICMLMTNTA